MNLSTQEENLVLWLMREAWQAKLVPAEAIGIEMAVLRQKIEASRKKAQHPENQPMTTATE